MKKLVDFIREPIMIGSVVVAALIVIGAYLGSHYYYGDGVEMLEIPDTSALAPSQPRSEPSLELDFDGLTTEQSESKETQLESDLAPQEEISIEGFLAELTEEEKQTLAAEVTPPRESVFGLGPYPEIPPDYPRQNIFDRIERYANAEYGRSSIGHELIQRVLSNNDVAPEQARLIKTTPAVSKINPHTPKMEIVVGKPGAWVKVTAVSKINPHTQEMEIVFDKPGVLVEVNGVDADPNPTMSVGAWQSTTVWTLNLSLFEAIHPPTNPLSTRDFLQTQVCFTVSYVDETGIHQADLDCVRLPFVEGRYIQPRIIEGTVKDGDVDVDIDKLHAFGFTFRFSEKLGGYLGIRPKISSEDPFLE